MNLPPDHLTLAQSAEISRRRRGRNWAMLVILAALAALFYAISIVKLFHHGPA